jgi:hypothetical protein
VTREGKVRQTTTRIERHEQQHVRLGWHERDRLGPRRGRGVTGAMNDNKIGEVRGRRGDGATEMSTTAR